ncbi:MAG TPA: hypothetical protein VGH19_09650 [Verrucomicrobiae bacterium]
MRAEDKQQAVAPLQPVKDTVCQTSVKPGAECHSPGSRATVLKAYITEQGKLTAKQSQMTSTNALKDCEKPPSRAALMQKAGPAAK